MTGRAATFADALQQLERDRDVETFVGAVFADDVVLLRPETGQENAGNPAAKEFWQQYLDRFTDIRSEFERVVDADDLGLLEWTSTGHLASGDPITYRGISVLDYAGDRVARFSTYYDTAPFAT